MRYIWLRRVVLVFGLTIGATVGPGAFAADNAGQNNPGGQTRQKQAHASQGGQQSSQKSSEKPSQKSATAGGGKSKPAAHAAAKKGNKSASGAQQPQARRFGYADVVAMARARAKKSYQPPAKIPGFLKKLSLSKYQQIKYKRKNALWRQAGLPYRVMFDMPGSYFDHAVQISVVNGRKTRSVPFDKQRFTFPDKKLKKKIPKDLGYAGFKVLHEMGHPGKLDEVLSFLGASYFRVIGANEHWGLSARGLSIDTASSSGEEFPKFTHFWLVKPGKTSRQLTIYALLDSPSVTGAYKFTVTPGQATYTHVEATFFTRKKIKKLGVAPLTSMFTRGKTSLARMNNILPEAHNSDGLLIHAATGEWLWRPLVDPQKLRLNDFDADHVKGFGLMQRDRRFSDYQSLKYQYQKRPNAWVTPDGDWGKGHLQLVEIPSNSIVNDNIVLYWVPRKPVKANQRLHFGYTIKWSEQRAEPDSLGRAIATRVGRVAPQPGKKKSRVKVMVDFAGGKLTDLTKASEVKPKVNARRDVTLYNIQLRRNPHTRGWRLTFEVSAKNLSKPLGLRAYLAKPQGGGITETWSYELKTP
ncbi:glucan biosynthesis protein [Salinisphaera sp. RV14]|uniref:glucan biosynthesis protein n=1 Tax=Salinisphaera sp. RV14 TaxID=3454140 RepID=UPI003F8323EF